MKRTRLRTWSATFLVDLPFSISVLVAFIAMLEVHQAPELGALLRTILVGLVLKTLLFTLTMMVQLAPVDAFERAVDAGEVPSDRLVQHAAEAVYGFPLRQAMLYSLTWALPYLITFANSDALPVSTRIPGGVYLFCAALILASFVFNIHFNGFLMQKPAARISLMARERKLTVKRSRVSFRALLVLSATCLTLAPTGWMGSAGYVFDVRSNARERIATGKLMMHEAAEALRARMATSDAPDGEVEGADLMAIVTATEHHRLFAYDVVTAAIVGAGSGAIETSPELSAWLRSPSRRRVSEGSDPDRHLRAAAVPVGSRYFLGVVTDDTPRSSFGYLFAMVFYAFVALTFAPSVAVFMGGAVAGPLARIAVTLRVIINRGNFVDVERVPIYRPDEIGALSTSANDMIAKLEEAWRKNREIVVQLQEKNRELVAAARMKSQFLASMSHELRTPLNAIIGFSRMVMKKTEGIVPEQQTRNLKLINDSGQALLALVNDLLDYERIEAGRLKLVVEDVDCVELAASLRDTMRPTAEARGLSLDVRVVHQPLRLRTDPDRLRQVLVNFINNAIKYSEAGAIDVRFTVEGDAVRIAVQDQGVGIPADQIAKVFEPFHQVDGSFSRQRDGVGLGLAIVKRLAELLGGHIELISEVGYGSTFTLVLPGSLVVNTPALSPAAPADLPQEGPLVMAVDDDQSFLAVLEHELSEAGYRVRTVASGAEALELAPTLRPHAIILDIRMPGMDGWEVLRRLRDNDATRAIPVLISSVLGDRSHALELGITAWLTKPFSPLAFKDALSRLERQSSMDALIVEDDEATLSMVEQQVSQLGFTVRRARTRDEALAELDKAVPAAMVLDLTLHGEEGVDVLESLRKRPAGRDTLVVVYTARDLSSDERTQLSDGLVRIVTKHGQNGVEGVLAELRSQLSRAARPALGAAADPKPSGGGATSS